MATTKYIRHMNSFVCFNKRLIHFDMAGGIFPGKLIHGAGFIMTTVDRNGNLLLETYGQSESLRINPGLDDAETMMKIFGFNDETTLSYLVYGSDVIVFSNEIDHKTVANSTLGPKPQSAGYVKLSVVDGKIDISLHGESKTLGISSNKIYAYAVCEALGIDLEQLN